MLIIQREAFHCSLTMLIMVSQSLQPCLHSGVTEDERFNLSLRQVMGRGWGGRLWRGVGVGGVGVMGDLTTKRKQKGTPGIRKSVIFIISTFNLVL